MIAVVGLGFVGLTTALGFCEKGFEVVGVDINRDLINALNAGVVPFHEPGLPEALERYLGTSLTVTSQFNEAVKKADVIFVCVGTPSCEDGSADLSYIQDVIECCLALHSKDQYQTFVIKSTVPPTSVSLSIRKFIEKAGFQVGVQIGLASNPEFLREGVAWNDFIEPDRIVIGVEDQRSEELLRKIYSRFDAPVHCVSINSAEFIKYLSNSFLATLISFSNEMSMIAKSIGGIDIGKAFKILHEDGRWSGQPANMASYAYPGCGYGGYCLPKDTEAINAVAKKVGYKSELINSVIEVNEKVRQFWVDEIAESVSTEKTIGILGLAFKPNSDDVRYSPSKLIIELLKEKGYQNFVAYDPLANDAFEKLYRLGLDYVGSVEALVGLVDDIVILTGWDEFLEKKALFECKNVFDLRYILVD